MPRGGSVATLVGMFGDPLSPGSVRKCSALTGEAVWVGVPGLLLQAQGLLGEEGHHPRRYLPAPIPTRRENGQDSTNHLNCRCMATTPWPRPCHGLGTLTGGSMRMQAFRHREVHTNSHSRCQVIDLVCELALAVTILKGLIAQDLHRIPVLVVRLLLAHLCDHVQLCDPVLQAPQAKGPRGKDSLRTTPSTWFAPGCATGEGEVPLDLLAPGMRVSSRQRNLVLGRRNAAVPLLSICD